MITRDDIDKIANDLLGTCKDLGDVLLTYNVTMDDVPTELLSALDDITLCCEECGWWVEASEVDDDGVCDECVSEREE